MKKASIHTLQALALTAGLISSPRAVAEEKGFYFDGALGGTSAENVHVKEFLGTGNGERVKLDPGIHVGFAGGYNFNEWLGAEFESGILANNIDRLGTTSPDASLSHVPFLVNIILRYEGGEDLPITPYFGAGLGGDSSIIIFDNSLGLDGSDATVVFAYQFMAGVRYQINERMSAGLGYKYFHADPPSWDVSNSSGQIRFGAATVHALSAVFNLKF